MMTFHDRLFRLLMTKEQFRKSDRKLETDIVAETLNISRRTFYNYINGNTFPSEVFIKDLVNVFPKLNLNWLLLGGDDSTMFDTNPDSITVHNPKFENQYFIQIKSHLESIIKEKEKRILLLEENYNLMKENYGFKSDQVKESKNRIKELEKELKELKNLTSKV